MPRGRGRGRRGKSNERKAVESSPQEKGDVVQNVVDEVAVLQLRTEEANSEANSNGLIEPVDNIVHQIMDDHEDEEGAKEAGDADEDNEEDENADEDNEDDENAEEDDENAEDDVEDDENAKDDDEDDEEEDEDEEEDDDEDEEDNDAEGDEDSKGESEDDVEVVEENPKKSAQPSIQNIPEGEGEEDHWVIEPEPEVDPCAQESEDFQKMYQNFSGLVYPYLPIFRLNITTYSN